MINNVSFQVHNIIIKYVEDDIVFSLNIKSLDLHTCDEEWQQVLCPATFFLLVMAIIDHISSPWNKMSLSQQCDIFIYFLFWTLRCFLAGRRSFLYSFDFLVNLCGLNHQILVHTQTHRIWDKRLKQWKILALRKLLNLIHANMCRHSFSDE